MEEYLRNISLKFARTDTAKGREMIYRTDFENLLKEIFMADGKVTQINHDSTSDNGNKPDFVISKNSVPVLYIEAKDIGIDLNKIEKGDQMNRYFGYDNLVLTDYLEFRFYRNGSPYGEPIPIAKFNKNNREIVALNENFSLLSKTLVDFASDFKEPIKNGRQLARIMGGKAQRIRDNVRDMLTFGNEKYTELLNIKKVVTENLVSSLKDEDFADMYAQTLVYGLFAARYNDKTNDTFSRAEARDLVPKTNPFLHSFFDHIAGASFPERLRFIVDELCEVFTHADVEKILHDFYGKEKDNKDPIIHFYEDFLKEYDLKKKMEMGVFYTPKPVVQFIVRVVDEILKKEFGLVKGLADTEKVKVKRQEVYQAQKLNKTEAKKDGTLVEVEKEYHKVQVLDVATGTGTFLNEVIEHIHKSFAGQEGRWESYVKENLLPRLHGFELMMASYTIAHLKMGMTLADSGVKDLNQRLGVYLTNTLDEPKDYSNQGSLFGFMDAIAEESKSASRVKSEYPIMCVIGNPPYSGISQNKNYTENSAYKIEPGGKVKLQERKHWLDDDYVKFIRFAESLIEKNGEGIMGMITAHGYIDNPTFRGMRWHLRNTFDKIYVVDLHGNANKKETTPDGGKDENVFDIKTGVSIIFGVKKGNRENKNLADVYKLDLYGLREEKFEALEKASFENVKWQKLPAETELWLLEGKGKAEYMQGFSVKECFLESTSGFVTAKDKLNISFSKSEMTKNINDLLTMNELDFRKKYLALKDSRDWQYLRAKKDAEAEDDFYIQATYRPFDTRWTFYTGQSRGLYSSPQRAIMNQFIGKINVGLVVSKVNRQASLGYFFISNKPTDFHVLDSAGDSTSSFPLYLYTDQNEKVPNLNKEIWDKINEVAGETRPENILDYIYAVLHSSIYREKYKEFLKIDFPRVPYPENKEKFFALAKLGEKLQGLHLMTDGEVNNFATTFPESGTEEVEKISYKDGKVYINANQYFGKVPEVAWNFYIGGYQPAQKYLKDRKGRKLTNDEIEQYQKIIKVLVETDKLMREIDFIK